MKNVAASVRDRLLNLARSSKQNFNSLLDQYGAERLLYRIAESGYARRFILKGSQLLLVHAATSFRPIRDIDLLGRGEIDEAKMAEIFKEICSMQVVDDGLDFDQSSVSVETLRDESEYPGLRVSVRAHLRNA